MIGTIEHFTGGPEEFEMYVERVEHLFKVNCVEEPMKVSMFITLAGPQVYGTLKNLLAPDKPDTKSYKDIIAVLRGHYLPEKSEISERFTFNKCNQKPNQSVSEYIVELRRLANTCKFGTFLDEALRDRLVCGLVSDTLQKKLLSESQLTFAKACSLAQAHEMATKQVQLLASGEQVHYINSRNQSGDKTMSQRTGYSSVASQAKSSGPTQNYEQKRRQYPNQQSQQQQGTQVRQRMDSCFRCGRQHNPNKCPAIDWDCFSCRRKGHTARMCQNKSIKAVDEPYHQGSSSSTHPEGELYPLNTINEDLYPLNNITDDVYPICISKDVQKKIFPSKLI